MAETRSKSQLPMSEVTARPPGADQDVQAFRRGLQVGREVAETAVRKIGAWAEEHPGQVVLAGLALGFVLGKLLSGRPQRLIEETE
jgi:ElaB/YqjD/DUF883 family membrane-anchored ribosome-binding protein